MKNAALFTSFSDLIKKIDQQGQGIVAAAAQPAEDVEVVADTHLGRMASAVRLVDNRNGKLHGCSEAARRDSEDRGAASVNERRPARTIGAGVECRQANRITVQPFGVVIMSAFPIPAAGHVG